MAFRSRGRKENDGKYFRLTGLWPSKKNDRLCTGKVRNQDLEKLQDKIAEAVDANADLVVFLWENTEKNGPKDPEFTVQISVSEDDGNSRGRSSRSSRSSGSSRSSRRDRDSGDNDNDDQDDNTDDDDNQEDDNDKEEEKPTRRGKSSKKEEPRKHSASSSKKDKNDW